MGTSQWKTEWELLASKVNYWDILNADVIGKLESSLPLDDKTRFFKV